MESSDGNSNPAPSNVQRGTSGERFEREKQEKAVREQMLRVVFTTEARERLSNIRMIKPELASSIEDQIFQLAASGKLRGQITDEELKKLLGSFQKPKREFKISWK